MKNNVLIIADPEDIQYLNTSRLSADWNIYWEVLDYSKLSDSIERLRENVLMNDIDFVLYSRNDQVENRINIGSVTNRLRIGYSSFSGIDQQFRTLEMQTLYEDFFNFNNDINFDISENILPNEDLRNYSGTFSLIFDVEQFGCVRYGLTRILPLLKRYDIKATFFITNLMKKIYPQFLDVILAEEHEIAIHGNFHEYISTFDQFGQRHLIDMMIKDINVKIFGANFIGRMNKDTVSSLIENNIGYFVYPALNHYRLFSYLKYHSYPTSITSNRGKIISIPINVETYNKPWFTIKNMIDTTFQIHKENENHITILCHPFREGNLQQIENFERLIRYVKINKKMRPIMCKELSINAGFHQLNLDIIEEENFKIQSINHSPITKRDILFAIPENIAFLYRKINKNRMIW